jgi:ubiquinone biosynthesis monooxygenase Coq7
MATAIRSIPETPGDRIMRVVHAGEHGAVQIYRGQRIGARWTAPGLAAMLAEFQSHEMRHRAIFAAELARRGRRRCRSYMLCGVGGWCLGLMTGLLGKGAIAATTVAVERVVLRHLADYRAALIATDAEAYAALGKILADEEAHHDAFDLVPPGWALRWIDPLVAASTEAVIRMGMRL